MLKRFLQAIYIPAFLLCVCITSYGLLSPWLGFHWDDWQAVWWKHTFGPSGFFEYFSGDRPPLAIIYFLTHSILDTRPFQWQVAGLLSRWVAGLLLLWTLKQVWPKHKEQVIWIALLFMVYPGFRQQPISVVWTNGILLLAAQLLSWGIMLKALVCQDRTKYWLLTAISLLSLALSIFSTEYFVGLELVRPILIWLLLREKQPVTRLRIQSTIRHWMPYILLLAVYATWRVFVIGFPTYHPALVESASTGSQNGILLQAFKIPYNLILTSWIAWSETFRFPMIEDLGTVSTRLYWIIVLASAAITYFFLSKIYHPVESNPPVKSTTWDVGAKQMLLGGIFTLCVAGVPFWVADLPIETHFPYDRFSLAFIPGSALLIVGILQMAIRTRTQKIVLLSLLVSMALGSNFSNANSFRREWETQKDFFWQLAWRAPQVIPNTFFLTYSLPFQYSSDNSLTAPLNWLYAPDHKSLDLPYFLGYMPVRLGRSLPKIEDLKPGVPIQQGYRSAMFRGNTSQVLLIHYSPPGCLRILDPVFDRDVKTFPRQMEEIISISNTAMIVPSPNQMATPPLEILGNEPPHTWCYYFEKAELARQSGNWDQVVKSGDQAFEQGLKPAEISELIVFIEGYAQHGDWEKSLNLMVEAYHAKPGLHYKLCSLLDRFDEESAPDQNTLETLINTKELMDCSVR